MATILVVDDNRDALDAIAMLLQELGHAIAKASSTREALDLLDESPNVGLIVSDVRMPGVSGFTFRRVVRHRFPKLPMILVTGLPITSDDVVPRDAAAILQKPVAIEELERAVAEALKDRPSS